MLETAKTEICNVTTLIIRRFSHIKAGTVSDRVTGFEDWMPTLLESAGAAMAARGGISFASALCGETQPERRFLYREFPGKLMHEQHVPSKDFPMPAVDRQ